MFRPILDLLRRLGLLSQRSWSHASWSLMSMSLPSRRGVIWSRRMRSIRIQSGTWNGSTMYPILYDLPYCRSWVHSSQTCLRRCYCWAVVGQTSSQLIPGHPKYQSLSWQHYGWDSWCVFKSCCCPRYGDHPTIVSRVGGGVGSTEEE